MDAKTSRQRRIARCNKRVTTGEMKKTLPNLTRVGALRTRGFMPPRLTRIFAILAVAALPCFAAAQDDAAPAASNAATTGTAESVDAVTIVASNMPIERVIGQLSDKTNVSISARGKTAGEKVSHINPNPMPLRDVLNSIVNSKPNWILYEPRDRPGTYEIWDQETYKAEVLPRLVRPKVFVPKEITAEEAAKALEGVMTPGIGKVAYDQRSNKVIMTDLVTVLELAQRLLQTIDVKFYTRVYSIEHADVAAVAEKLSALKSPAAPDVQVDERTRQIIVSDRIDILQKMEQLVQTLDIGPEMRVYTINNLGVEGTELDELEAAIEGVLTADAYFHFNIRQGKLIVRDLPEVQERIEKILEAFDAPVRQVLLQLEIIETEFSDGFNWSVDYAFSGDLLGAVTDGLVSGIPTGATPGADGKPVEGSEGFVNFRKEFPVVQAGSKGLNAQMLTKHAFVKLQAAMSDSRTRILQQPRMLVENQKLASFDVGQSVPFFSGGSIGVTNTGGVNNLTPSQPVQQLLQVGLFVECTPIISANGMVELEITVENSSPLRVDQTFAGQSYTGMGKTNQNLETTMWVPSGATRVIGGLVTDSKSETRSGIPGLSRIPYLGPALFGSYTKNPEDNRRRNLLIFITPTIVEETPSNPQKYKGVLMANLPQEAVAPSPTVTDLGPYKPTLQLEKGGMQGYTPPPMPDFESMTRTPTEDGHILLSPAPSAHQEAPPSLTGIEAEVNIKSLPKDVDLEFNGGDDFVLPPVQPETRTERSRVRATDLEPAAAPDLSAARRDSGSAVASASASAQLDTLPRVRLEEAPASPDEIISSMVAAAGPSGSLSTGTQNLIQPKASPTPAASPAPAAPAASPAAKAAATPAVTPPRATAPPPARETNHR